MRRAISLVGANVIGQLALLAALPVLTRTFGPEELGPYQTALALALMVQPFATFRAELIIPTVGLWEARQLRTWSIWGTVTGSAILAVCAYFAMRLGGAWEFLLIAALVLPAYALMAIDTALLIRGRKLARVAARNILSGLFVALLQIVAAVLLESVLAVAAALLLGRLFAVSLTRDPVPIDLREGGSVSRRWTFGRGILTAFTAFVANAPGQGFRLYGAAVLGPSAAAQIGVAQQSSSAPLGLVSQGLAQLVQAEIAPIIRTGEGSLERAVWRQLAWMAPAAMVVSTSLLILGPVLAVPIFGPEWSETGGLIAILGIPAGFQLLVAPLMPVFVMLGRERLLLSLQVARVILIAVVIGVCGVIFPASGLLHLTISFSIGSSIGFALVLIVLLRIIRAYPNRESARSMGPEC